MDEPPEEATETNNNNVSTWTDMIECVCRIEIT